MERSLHIQVKLKDSQASLHFRYTMVSCKEPSLEDSLTEIAQKALADETTSTLTNETTLLVGLIRERFNAEHNGLRLQSLILEQHEHTALPA